MRSFFSTGAPRALVATFLAACALLTAAPQPTGTATHASTPQSGEIKKYTCSMHPEVSSDKPGKCPKCGMELVEKKKT